MTKTRFFLLFLALGVEAALLSLGHWQYRRWQQRLNEQHATAIAPLARLEGLWVGTAVVLDNQPAPTGQGVGWRLLQALDTGTGRTVVDRGFFVPANRTVFNASVFTASGTAVLDGVWAEAPPRHGWLKGPDTTTADNILAFFNPTRVDTRADTQRYFVSVTPTQTGVEATRPPTAAPERHLGYMVQWLLMAGVFPLLCLAALRRKKA